MGPPPARAADRPRLHSAGLVVLARAAASRARSDGRSLVATGLLALEPIVGWWMVSSGLAERTEVAQERLALHLLIAAATFGALIYAAVGLDRRRARGAGAGFAAAAGALRGADLLSSSASARWSPGLRAGLIYNTWPLMGGKLVPARPVRPVAVAALDRRRRDDRAIRPSSRRLLVVAVRSRLRVSPRGGAHRARRSPCARACSPRWRCCRRRWGSSRC